MRAARVAVHSPMIRGLKGSSPTNARPPPSAVAVHSPMIRGLKEDRHRDRNGGLPDVAVHSPMIRGLKDVVVRRGNVEHLGQLQSTPR